MSRWKTLERTSPSGKRLFECQRCGRVSLTRDKKCLTAGCGFASDAEALDELSRLMDRFRTLGDGP